MKFFSKFFLPIAALLALAGCGGGGGSNSSAFTAAYTVTVAPQSASIGTNSFTTVVVSVKGSSGASAADGTSVTVSVSPATLGSISSVASGSTAGTTATGSTVAGSVSFVFSSGAATGTATITASASSTTAGSSSGSASIAINAGPGIDPRLQLTASTQTLPPNPYNPEDGSQGFPGNYIGSPYISEVTLTWRRTNGQLYSGTANVAVSPTTVAGYSTLDNPSTPWSGQTATPPTDAGNEFLTILGSGTVTVTAGIGTIFVHSFNVPGTATLTVTATDPDTQQTISSQMAFTVVAGATSALPASVQISPASAGIYVNGSNGPQSTPVSAQVFNGNDVPVTDPTDGQGNTWDNVQFDITGPSGTDARLSAINAAGQTVTGTSVKTVTHSGIATVTLLAGSVQGATQVRVTVDRGDNNVDNGIQNALTATTTVVISDGKLYSLTLSSPVDNSISTNPVSGNVTACGSSATTGTANGTYCLTVSATGNDRQGNPVVPGTPIRFGLIDAPQANYAFQIAGSQGNPVEGGTSFTATDGRFLTAGGGSGPGDTLLVFGKKVAGNADLESALKIQSVLSNTSLTTVSPFNRNDTTGVVVDSGNVLPYVIGRALYGNITSPSTTNNAGVASTTLNYPISSLSMAVAVYAQGDGTDTNVTPATSTLVTDIAQTSYPGIVPLLIISSPNTIPANITSTISVCVQDAQDSPLPNTPLSFTFTGLGVGTGSVNGAAGAGSAGVTGANGCLSATVSTSGINGGGATLTFTVPGSSQLSTSSTNVVTISAGNTILQASPSVLGAAGGTVTLTLLNSNGTPVAGVLLTGTCNSTGLTTPPGTTNASGSTTAVIGPLTGTATTASCTFTTGTGTPTVTVNLN